MQARVDDIKYMRDDEGFWLRIRIPHDDVSHTMNWMAVRNPNKAYDLELKEHREKRSLDANGKLWKLLEQLSSHLGISKEEAYRNSIKGISGNSEILCCREEAADDFCRIWESRGVGWITERLDSKIDGCINLVLYYGSSTYDTKQFSRLLDNVIQDCKAVGIETLSPEELARLKEEWK